VDKPDFLHRLNGLRAFQAAAQALFLARTLTGQKFGRGQTRQFRTFDPVDMHGLIHSSAGFFLQNRFFSGRKRCRSRNAVQVDSWTNAKNFFLTSCDRFFAHFFINRSASNIEVGAAELTKAWSKPPFFSNAFVFANAGRQVYNQKLVYRIVIVVNDPHPLWISQVLFTRSNVYVPHKAVRRPCMCLVEKLDKIRGRRKKQCSSQSVPVDMQTLIHNG
jgi:hypothetical protein